MELIIATLIVTGFVLLTVSIYFWYGLPVALLMLATGKGKKIVRRVSAFSLSSVPAILESRTVYEFIQTLPNQDKAAAYNDIMSNMRKLLLDVKKHREAYPKEIEALKSFVLSQIRYNIERSPAVQAIETAKFRDLAETYCLTEVMQGIYMADCKVAREAAHRNIRLPKEGGL